MPPGGDGFNGGWGGGPGGGMVLSRRMFASLANRDFRRVWISNLSMMFAMQAQMVARGWLIYDMTSSPIALAWVLFSMMGPMFFFSLVGGVLADRLRKKRVIIASQALNAVSALALGTIIVTDNVTFTHFILFGLFNGTILPLSMPARQAIIPEIVGEEGLVNAMALNMASMNLSRILAPTLAGVLIAVVAGGDTTSALGVGIVFYIIAGLYLVSIITLSSLRHEGRSLLRERHGMLDDIGAGLSYVRKTSVILGLLALAFVPLLFGMPVQFLLPAFNKNVLDMGPDGLGLLMGGMGVGALIGSLALGDVRRKGLILIGSALLWAISMGLFATSSQTAAALAFLAIVGLFQTTYMALNMTLFQLAVIPEMRGRVMSLMMMTFDLMPLGVFPMSIVAERVGIDVAILASAIGLGALTILLAMVVPAIRRIDRGHGPSAQAHERLVGLVAGLNDEQLAWRPTPHSHSLGFALWHVARCDDNYLRTHIGGRPEIWLEEGWFQQWGLDRESTGMLLSDEQAAGLSLPGKDTLLSYTRRVWEEMETFVGALGPEEMSQLVAQVKRTRGMSTGQVITTHIYGHENRHLGEMEYLKGSWD